MTLAETLLQRGVDPATLRTRPLDLAAYASDASHYLLTPSAVIVAEDEGQVAKVMAACHAERLPVTFRSGGTSLSGQAGSRHVLVDVRRGFRGVEVLDGGLRIRVSPGTTVRATNAALRPYGRILGPDPASEAACTIGGVVANNSSGMSCGVEGSAYRTLDSLRVILPSGTVVDTGEADADRRLAHDEPDLHAGLLRLMRAVRSDATLSTEIRRQFSMKNTMGYGVNALLDHDSLAEVLAHLVVGSEGTLAFIASATLRTLPLRPHSATGLLLLPDLSAATDLLPSVIDSGAAAIELLDSRSLHVAARSPRAVPVLRNTHFVDHAALLVEYQAVSEAELSSIVDNASHLFSGAPLSSDYATRASLWHIRKGLYASVAGARSAGTTAILEDVAVPVDALTPTCAELSLSFARHGYDEAVVFGHAKDGNLHFMVTENFSSTSGLQRYADFTEDLVDVVLKHGGTLKAEHGTGRAMAPFVERQYGSRLYAMMREIKQLFDPARILNPGVIISEDPRAHVHDLKTVAPVDEAVDRCVECGLCEPVCPSQDLTLTPRQRIVTQRAAARAEAAGLAAEARTLQAQYRYDGVETCAADGLCQTSCPVGIDTGDLARRFRQQESGRLVQWTARTVARHWGPVTRAASAAATAAHTAPSLARRTTQVTRALLGSERVPLWSADLPPGGPRRTGRDGGPAVAVLLPSCQGSLFGGVPSASDALLQLCRRADVEVVVPADAASLCCGVAFRSKGLTAAAEELETKLAASLARLASSSAAPLTVVSDASSCSDALSKALGDTSIVVRDAIVFADRQLLPRLSPRILSKRLAAHPTCATTKNGASEALLALSAAVADDVFVPPSWGCCGFAGDRGMLHPELTAAATSQQAQEIRAYGADAHVSCNRSCEVGMSRATGAQYRHVLTLLEEATR